VRSRVQITSGSPMRGCVGRPVGSCSIGSAIWITAWTAGVACRCLVGGSTAGLPRGRRSCCRASAAGGGPEKDRSGMLPGGR
jgi:hypothetical protein